jgi:hypothetical protein
MYGEMGPQGGTAMVNFIPSEDQNGVEQLKRSAVIATQNVARLRRQLEKEPDEFTRSRLLELLLHEAEKSRLTHQQLDRIDCHMAELRELSYRQVELVEKGAGWSSGLHNCSGC